MAGISIEPINVNTTPAPAVRNMRGANAAGAAGGVNQTAATQAADTAKEAAEAQREKSAEVRREQLEDVIAVSKDGDTVQATNESRERLAEDAFGHMEVRQGQEATAADQAQGQDQQQDQTVTGEVTEEAIAERTQTAIEGSKTQQAIAESVNDRLVNGSRSEEAIAESIDRTLNGTSRTEEAVEAGNERAEQEEAEKEYNEKLASYQGISDMMLEQMYLKGEISKIDYDKEMESREEIREAEGIDNAQFSNEMTGAAVLQESGQRDLQEIETAFSPEANNNLSGEQRMEILETLEAQQALNFNTQDAANVISDANASGEETIKKVVFS